MNSNFAGIKSELKPDFVIMRRRNVIENRKYELENTEHPIIIVFLRPVTKTGQAKFLEPDRMFKTARDYCALY